MVCARATQASPSWTVLARTQRPVLQAVRTTAQWGGGGDGTILFRLLVHQTERTILKSLIIFLSAYWGTNKYMEIPSFWSVVMLYTSNLTLQCQCGECECNPGWVHTSAEQKDCGCSALPCPNSCSGHGWMDSSMTVRAFLRSQKKRLNILINPW